MDRAELIDYLKMYLEIKIVRNPPKDPEDVMCMIGFDSHTITLSLEDNVLAEETFYV